jgi:two-component system sensor histidine kinase KdpD
VTAVDFRLHVNSATAGFTYLVLILALATSTSLPESITASLVSAVAYNFFFLPPIGTFTIADPQNWIALVALLATAITATHLSASARRRAEEARSRHDELQRMYDFSRGLMLGSEERTLGRQVVDQIARSFELPTAWFYDRTTESISKVDDAPEIAFQDHLMTEVAASAISWQNARGNALVVPVKLGGASLGSLGVSGEHIPSPIALEAIARLVAVAIERSRVQEAAARFEASRESEQLKSTLLEALAHEFKTPLTSVKAATTTLLSASLRAQEQRDLIIIIDEEADRMIRLVSDSIEMARIGTSSLAPQREVCSPEDLISSVIDSMRGLLESRSLEEFLAPGLPSVLVDKSLTELVLRQILNNAVKYSPPRSPVRVRAERDNLLVRISVSNNGPGIPKKDQEKIFERFYRGPDVRTRVAGTGLGLSIAREIIEAQGGRISVESDCQKGTTFSITLPVSSVSERAAI